MTKTNTIEILGASPQNHSPLGDVYNAQLLPAGKRIFVVSGKPLNKGDVFATGDMAEVFGTAAIGNYETHQYPKPQQPKDPFDIARELILEGM